MQMLMSRQALLPGRILQQHDRYQDWRLDVDDMSYEVALPYSNCVFYYCDTKNTVFINRSCLIWATRLGTWALD